MGHRFLRHIERNPVLLFLIPADSDDHKKEFEVLLKELEKYNPELLHKQFIIAISKSDMLDEELITAIVKELPKNITTCFYFFFYTKRPGPIERSFVENIEPIV